MSYRYTKSIVAFAIVLALFLVLEEVAIISQQREVLHTNALTHAGHEIEIISFAMRADILLHNYANAELVLKKWGEKHEKIVMARATAPNGFVISEYNSEEKAVDPFRIKHTIMQNNTEIAFIEVDLDFSVLDRNFKGIYKRMMIGSLVFVVLMGMALWYTQRIVALNPLEREIALREEAEKRLKDSHDMLEHRVEERTEDLRRSEHSYRTLAVNLPGIVYRISLKDKKSVQFFNESVRTMTGYSLDKLSPEEGFAHYWRRVPKSDRQRVRKHVKESIEGDQPYEVEYGFTHADGGTRYFLERGRPVFENGNPLHIDGVVLDITASRLSEQESKRLYSTLDALVMNIPIGIILLDNDNRIALMNPIGENYLQHLSDARKGDPLTLLADKPLSDLLITPPHITRHEITSTGTDGRTVVYDAAARNISSDRGGGGGVVVMIRDVTEERELQQWAQTHEKLAAVGQLASGIAHDFSNILTCVVGFSEMLLSEQGFSEEEEHQLKAIHESGLRGTDLIGQILDFSRTSVDDRKPIDLEEAVRGFIKFLDRILSDDIIVTVESTGGDYTVNADETKLQQVLANLAVNARDAMPEGGRLDFLLSLHVAGGPSAPGEAPPLPDIPDGHWVCLKVSDSGEGVPEDMRKHIFDPFFTTKEQGKGTGLGLAQVYGIVKQHGGHIFVESGPEVGTTFSIFLPQVRSIASSPDVGAEDREFPRGESRTILVVEDDAVVRDLMVTVLEEMGHNCLEGGDGVQGLRKFKENSSDIALVVTDLAMPEMNGIQMSRKIREISPDTIIIAVSGYPQKNGEETKDLFTAFIKKPFKALGFAKEVDMVIKAKVS